jgi:membrane protein YqaA with SNARE-associated domain
MVMILAMMLIYIVPGSHQEYVKTFEYELKIMIWWIGLGVLSSIGLGTGLHTFVLYLGPWIAQVTLAGTECKSLNFDTYGSNRFLCPDNVPKDSVGPTYGDIMVMVWFEAFLWGAGTALGELPPYFVAKQASKSGKKLREITGEEEDVGKMAIILSWFKNRGTMGKFFLILCFASVPNPLFDLAGLISGYLMLPFLSFFIPTLIGKGIIKVSIQAAFIILVFNAHTLEIFFNFLEDHLPFLKDSLHKKFESVRKQFHKTPGEHVEIIEKSMLATIWDFILIVMISYFIISIINARVQETLINEHKIIEEEHNKLKED